MICSLRSLRLSATGTTQGDLRNVEKRCCRVQNALSASGTKWLHERNHSPKDFDFLRGTRGLGRLQFVYLKCGTHLYQDTALSSRGAGQRLSAALAAAGNP